MYLQILNGRGSIMLILTRKLGESLMIGDGNIEDIVKLKILGIKGNQVRIGIDAPKEVSVHRKEIFERIQQQDEAMLEIETID